MKRSHVVALHAYGWINYTNMPPEEIETIAKIGEEPPKGRYYGRLPNISHALFWDVHNGMGIPLLQDSDSYADDLPYWFDIPMEKNEAKPERVIMIP